MTSIIDRIPKETLRQCREVYRLSDDVIIAYANSLDAHINYVIQAATDFIGMEVLDVKYHDASKWEPDEFPIYAKHFFGERCPDEFSVAWLMHLHRNPHHWQHWIIPEYNIDPKQSDNINGANHSGILPMPERYCMEMVADWLGASMAYTGSWNIQKWLDENFMNVKLRPDSLYLVKNILIELGYRTESEQAVLL